MSRYTPEPTASKPGAHHHLDHHLDHHHDHHNPHHPIHHNDTDTSSHSERVEKPAPVPVVPPSPSTTSEHHDHDTEDVQPDKPALPSKETHHNHSWRSWRKSPVPLLVVLGLRLIFDVSVSSILTIPSLIRRGSGDFLQSTKFFYPPEPHKSIDPRGPSANDGIVQYYAVVLALATMAYIIDIFLSLNLLYAILYLHRKDLEKSMNKCRFCIVVQSILFTFYLIGAINFFISGDFLFAYWIDFTTIPPLVYLLVLRMKRMNSLIKDKERKERENKADIKNDPDYHALFGHRKVDKPAEKTPTPSWRNIGVALMAALLVRFVFLVVVFSSFVIPVHIEEFKTLVLSEMKYPSSLKFFYPSNPHKSVDPWKVDRDYRYWYFIACSRLIIYTYTAELLLLQPLELYYIYFLQKKNLEKSRKQCNEIAICLVGYLAFYFVGAINFFISGDFLFAYWIDFVTIPPLVYLLVLRIKWMDWLIQKGVKNMKQLDSVDTEQGESLHESRSGSSVDTLNTDVKAVVAPATELPR